MLNKDIYLKNPATHKLVNEGVASVNDDQSLAALDVLRYELETFVCDGQYEKGMEHILSTYLDNLNEAQQPAVWVSGFYGSGKSHLVKMLRALWVDTVFPDGATARGIADLPQSIRDHLKELRIQGQRHGGLHAASGTLGAGASGSVRLALLRVIFRSIGLPEQYPVARFVMWLQQEDIFDAVKDHVENNGYTWQEELDNFYVAEGLHQALVDIKPHLFSSPATCVDTLNNLYPYVNDVASSDMVQAVRQALTRDGKFPLTVIALDEVQQYIGTDSQRSIDVQEAVEAVCKNIGSKLLFMGTGQTAVTGTSNLAKLQGRFTIRIELSDTDVDAVVRKVILAKKPDAIAPIKQIMQDNLGEISRHLAGTIIGHAQNDVENFSKDYPILPVRRRFWEHTLRALDQTGTASQLRNQLSMIHKVIQTNLDEKLGHVVPADYLYFDSADKLLQARILPRKVHEKTMSWLQGSMEEQLVARACGLVFLINKMADANKETGVAATADTLADLMVTDLAAGSSFLHNKLPKLLAECDLLMQVGEEYRIQTEENSAWNDDFLSQQAQLANESHRIETERDDRIRRKFGQLAGNLSLTQGNSKVARSLSPVFDSQLPHDHEKKMYIWVRDGWAMDENSVIAEARQAGNQSPTIFVFIPRRSADDLRHHIMTCKAATATLGKRGIPSTPEGREARSAMETTRQAAEGKINELLHDAFSGARIFQGGGNEILGNDLQDMVLEAAGNALQRLYPQFHVADHAAWDKVLSRARKGAPDALKTVGDDGEPAKNPVCKSILSAIAGGKSGAALRTLFEDPPYGWSRDAVDGALQVLLIAGLIRVQDDRGNPIDPKELARKQIGKTFFKVESTTITTVQRIQVRKLLQKMECSVKSGEELSIVPTFLQKMEELAQRAGGEPPKPERPDTKLLDEIRLSVGNEPLMAMYNSRDDLEICISQWQKTDEQIAKRVPAWRTLQQLLSHCGDLKAAREIRQQTEAMEHQRLLLADPDPVQPLLQSLEQELRTTLGELAALYDKQHAEGMKRLQADTNWQQLEPEQKNRLLAAQKLTNAERPGVHLETTQEIVTTLSRMPLPMFADRLAAMKGRFDLVLEEAAELMEPEAQFIRVPRQTIKTDEDIEAWIATVKKQLKTALAQGPVVIR